MEESGWSAGLSCTESEDYFEVESDVFRSVPLYVAKRSDGGVSLFSNMEKAISQCLFDFAIDEVGLWETILFGGAIGKRTLFKYVYQLPADSKLSVNKHTLDFTVKSKGSYAVEIDHSIDSERKAAEYLYDCLSSAFEGISANEHYALGMSGGMDSRLTLALLKDKIDPDRTSLYTYGYRNSILEYKYASQISEKLGFQQPYFYELNDLSYLNALEYMPKLSAGQLGINHCHVFEIVRSKHLPQKAIHISSYYSDAILGWSASDLDSYSEGQSSYSAILRRFPILPDEIRDEIEQDIEGFFKGMEIESSITSKEEYKYIVERNPKFHVYLMYLQSRMVRTEMPFLSESLLTSTLSIPAKFRKHKRLLDIIINSYFPAIAKVGDISSRFQWGGGYAGRINFTEYRARNFVNALMRAATNGRYEFPNKYQTENQEIVLRRSFKSILEQSTQSLVELDVFTLDQKNYFDRIPVRNAGVGERFQLITAARVVHELVA